MQLSMKYIILYVQDVEKSIHFYETILGLPKSFQSGTYVEFSTGATTFALNTREDVRQTIGIEVADVTSQTFEIGFVVENVEETIETLQSQGVQIVKNPETKPWGQTVAYVADPDGHYIEICSSLG